MCQNNENGRACEASCLEAEDAIEQNNRDDIVHDTFAENARVKFGLLRVADNGYGRYDVGRAEERREKEQRHNSESDFSRVLLPSSIVDYFEVVCH